MSRRTALTLSGALMLLFAAAAVIYALSFAPAGGVKAVARPAESAAILTGGDGGERIPAELLPGELIDINTADSRQLMRLPGIGETLAGAVTAFRQEHGPFESAEDIKLVDGIGEGKYAAIAENITVNGE